MASEIRVSQSTEPYTLHLSSLKAWLGTLHLVLGLLELQCSALASWGQLFTDFKSLECFHLVLLKLCFLVYYSVHFLSCVFLLSQIIMGSWEVWFSFLIIDWFFRNQGRKFDVHLKFFPVPGPLNSQVFPLTSDFKIAYMGWIWDSRS